MKDRDTLIDSLQASDKINWTDSFDAQYACNIIIDGYGVNILERSNLFRKWFNKDG